MSRSKTQNIPDLSALLAPQNSLMLAVEQAVLRGHEWSRAAAPVAEQIAARIAGIITLDLVHAGQRLLEQDISEVLHVSRAPVREALRILERDRLVEFQPRRGATVTAPDAKELHDIFTVRGALYHELLKQVMAECPDRLEAVLKTHLPRLAKAGEESGDAYAVASFLLNLAISDLCSNRLLADLLKSISLRTLRYVRLGRVTSPASVQAALKTWGIWQKAIESRDTDAVLRIAVQRIQEMRDVAVRALPPPGAKEAPARLNGRARAAAPAPVKPEKRSRPASAARA